MQDRSWWRPACRHRWSALASAGGGAGPLRPEADTSPASGGDRPSEPAADHLLGLADDALDQLPAGRDVLDEAHHRAGRPDAVLEVASLVDHLAARAGDDGADLLDGLALVLHLDRLLG